MSDNDQQTTVEGPFISTALRDQLEALQKDLEGKVKAVQGMVHGDVVLQEKADALRGNMGELEKFGKNIADGSRECDALIAQFQSIIEVATRGLENATLKKEDFTAALNEVDRMKATMEETAKNLSKSPDQIREEKEAARIKAQRDKQFKKAITTAKVAGALAVTALGVRAGINKMHNEAPDLGNDPAHSATITTGVTIDATKGDFAAAKELVTTLASLSQTRTVTNQTTARDLIDQADQQTLQTALLAALTIPHGKWHADQKVATMGQFMSKLGIRSAGDVRVQTESGPVTLLTVAKDGLNEGYFTGDNRIEENGILAGKLGNKIVIPTTGAGASR